MINKLDDLFFFISQKVKKFFEWADHEVNGHKYTYVYSKKKKPRIRTCQFCRVRDFKVSGTWRKDL